MQLISKSTSWLKLHKPELLEQFAPSEFERHLMEQGNEVDVHLATADSSGFVG